MLKKPSKKEYKAGGLLKEQMFIGKSYLLFQSV